MSFDLENIRQQLTQVLAVYENLWIDRQALRMSLELVYKVAPDEIQNIETQARADSTMRQDARMAFSEMRAVIDGLEHQGREAVFEDLLQAHDPKKPAS